MKLPWIVVFLAAPACVWAFAAGSISGVVKDPSGAAIPGARLTLINTALKTEFKTTSDAQGFYSFPALPVGHYDLTIEAAGFQKQQKKNLAVDADAALRIDAVLQVGERAEAVTVIESETAVQTQVDTVATHLGEVVSDRQIEALPLNGRSYTDLLAIQPGVSPVTTLTPTSVIMAGVTGTINPSGDLNPGDVSIDGQRESANGFMVNAIDVQEHMNGGTSVIPNLDSIQEFRVLTNNFDPEYGNYNGGMINVVTKSGSNAFHGDAFEFLRNTDLDARNYFDSTRGAFRQNQFGGAIGGPIKKNRVFFFRRLSGNAHRGGHHFAGDLRALAAGSRRQLQRHGEHVDGHGQRTVHGQAAHAEAGLRRFRGRALLHARAAPAPSTCVLPNAVIPTQRVVGAGRESAAIHSHAEYRLESLCHFRLSGDRAGRQGRRRIDANTRLGQISGYYFVDNYRLDNPYPGGQGGASIPGFDALTIGQAQMITLGDTKVLGATTVNEFHVGFLRNVNNIGQPHGGLGVTLQSQGFVTGVGTPGIVVQAPQFEGVENIVFPSFVMGVPITNVDQWNNTLYLSDTVSKVIGTHTLKFGGQFHDDQVNENPNATFNGTFNIDGTETGSAFADFLLGFPSNFTQTTGPALLSAEPLRRRLCGR